MTAQLLPTPQIDVEPCSLTLPNYIPYTSPSTKWLLNTFRNAADHRLMAMLKEKPKIFRYYFQIRDNPSELLRDPHDTKSMFGETTLLYLRPLSLAVYMRCSSAIQILLDSKTSCPQECGYACEVFVPLQDQCNGDILEFPLTCIAVRRQFFEALPIIFQADGSESPISLGSRNLVTTRYVNHRFYRTNRYEDILHYAFDMALINRSVNLVRLLDVLIHQCPGFYTVGKLDEVKSGKSHSLFRRLAHLAIYVDKGSRMSTPLIQCMELLIRNSHFQQNKSKSMQPGIRISKVVKVNLSTAIESWTSFEDWLQDYCICAALIFLLYANLMTQHKAASVSNAGNLLYHMLTDLHALPDIFSLPIQELATVLDFLLSNDLVGQAIIKEKRPNIFRISHLQGERGDTCSFNQNRLPSSPTVYFTLRKPVLTRVVTKLKGRERLARLRQLHLLSSAHRKNDKFGHQAGSSTISTHSPNSGSRATSELHTMCIVSTDMSDRQMKSGGLHRTRMKKRIHSQVELNKTKCYHSSKMRASIGNVSRDQSSANLMTDKKLGATLHPRQEVTDKGAAEKHESLAFQAIVEYPEVAEEHSVCESSCPATSELDSTGADVAQNIDQPVNKKYDCLNNPAENAADKTDNAENNDVPECNTRIPAEVAHISIPKQAIFRDSTAEYLSLEDVDHLIDCITTTALAGEESLEGKLIEDLFDVYLDCDARDTSTISRANSRISAQVYADQEEAKQLFLAEPLPAEANIITSRDGNIATENYAIPVQCDKTSSYFRTMPPESCSTTPKSNQTEESTVQSITSERNRNCQVQSRKHNWSCARPLIQLNQVFGALRQFSYTKRKSSNNS